MSIPTLKTCAQLGATLLCSALITGCATPDDIAHSGPQKESTLGDALAKAQGQQGRRHAASQIQLGFGDQSQAAAPETTPAAAHTRAAIRPLREAKTFLGTVPCPEGQGCSALRVTLTLAPNGQWRARYQPLDEQSAVPRPAELGCWYPAGSQPWRIVLRKPGQDGTLASLSFVNDNVLRVSSFQDRTPTLAYQLTRQPDLADISELDKQPAPDCR